jgi:flagellar basal body rod protein FlgF
MRAIAAALTAAGLNAQVHQTRGVVDITATWHRPGSKDIDLTLDDDGYIAVSWWSPAGAAPAQVTALISRVLAAVTGPS